MSGSPRSWPDPLACLTLEVLSDKWVVPVLGRLTRGACRFSVLLADLEGVSSSMLTRTLHSMQRDGLVERALYPVVPPRTEYSLSPLGVSLGEPLGHLAQWAADHLDEVGAARARHDARRR